MNQSLSISSIQAHLKTIGYQADLLSSGFQLGNGTQIALAAFAQAPADARTACIAILEAEEGSIEVVRSCQSLAAPIVFVSGRNGLEWWKQGADQPERLRSPIPPGKIPQFFKTHADELAPSAVYRAKTWGRFDSAFQLSFVDFGLMPLVEAQIGQTLVQIISRQVQSLMTLLKWDVISEAKGQWLLKVVFWLVSAKILHDKRVGKFKSLDLLDAEHVLNAVGEHFDTTKISITTEKQRRALTEIASSIAQTSSLQLATTESLAYVYENTLISKATRQSLGTHSTPSYLVDYIVGRLRPWIEEIPLQQRHVFEPACGHAAFLVSAMRLLTELLPEDKSSPAQRRAYLRQRIHGCEIDAFALEIARLSLSLTDIPNPDGWDLTAGDMFEGDTLEQQARKAMILLANPPFENFSGESKSWYQNRNVELHHVNKTAELLARVLPELSRDAVLGVVVPQGFLHSKNATPVRKLLTTDFELQEICLFPDKVFTFSDIETAVLIARKTSASAVAGMKVRFRRIRERDIDAFRLKYETTSDILVNTTEFVSENASLRIPDFPEIWRHCQTFATFNSIAEIGQGFTFRGNDLPRGAETFSQKRFPKAIRGFLSFNDEIEIHETPPEVWLNVDPEVVLRPRHGTTVGLQQIVFNEAPSSRGPWRLKSLRDPIGHPVTGRFNVVRPRNAKLTPLEFLWALCNSPIANAYAYSHSGKRHNDAGMFRNTPVPGFTEDSVKRVIAAAQVYLNYVQRDPEAVLQRHINPQKARSFLLRVDCEILKLYALPRELEWRLLKLFDGWQRAGVPFKFDRYFPEHFEGPITLSEYIAITDNWPQTNDRRCELIKKSIAQTLTNAEQREFDYLQSLAGFRQDLIAPLPLDELEAMHRRLTQELAE